MVCKLQYFKDFDVLIFVYENKDWRVTKYAQGYRLLGYSDDGHIGEYSNNLG